jgi:beta-glucosidase
MGARPRTAHAARTGLTEAGSRGSCAPRSDTVRRGLDEAAGNGLTEPFLNLDRDTSWGRAFNTFGEDPLLTGVIGAATIRGIQRQGVLAQAKHLLAFEGGYNVWVDEQTLHEVYLRPFEYAVQAGVASMMCAYNMLNGVPACGSAALLTQLLRNELGFTGFVTSDWAANHAGPYLNAGLDMEMPGPGGAAGDPVPTFFDAATLKQGLARGWLQEARLNEAVARILGQYARFGLLDERPNVTSTDTPTVILHTAEPPFSPDGPPARSGQDRRPRDMWHPVGEGGFVQPIRSAGRSASSASRCDSATG